MMESFCSLISIPYLLILRLKSIISYMKRNNVMTGLFMGLLLLGSSCNSKETKEKKVTSVQLFTVRNSEAVSVQDFPGRVMAAEEVNLAFKVSGTLNHVHVEEGHRISKGQLIAEIDPRDYQIQLEATEAEYLKIKTEAERVIALYDDSVTTADAYDKARYGLQQITAKYENARNQLADTKIYAPFDGYIQKRLFDPPTVVSAGMPVVTLVSAGRQEIEINIPASTYLKRAEIASFSVSFAFLPEQDIPLSLISMAPKANANQLYTVRLAIPDNISPQPSPGMNAMVKVTFRDTINGKTEIPSSALLNKDGQSCVWVYDKEKGNIRQRIVSVERLDTKGHAIVTQGITEGEQIVIVGVHKLTDNQQVTPTTSQTETNIGDLL